VNPLKQGLKQFKKSANEFS